MHVLTFLWLAHSACRSLEAVQQTICIPIKIKTDLFVKRLRVGTCVKMQTCMLISFYVLCPTSSASFDFIAVHPFCACVVRLCVCVCVCKRESWFKRSGENRTWWYAKWAGRQMRQNWSGTKGRETAGCCGMQSQHTHLSLKQLCLALWKPAFLFLQL